MAQRIRGKIFPPFGENCDDSADCRCKHLCKKQCLAQTSHRDIAAARRFVHVDDDKKGLSERMREYTDINLKRPDGHKFCVECQTVFWGCSRNKLYPPKPKAALKGRRYSVLDVCIMAWFMAQLFCLDVDPVDGTRTMPASRKRQVYDWYMEDAHRWPDCYQPTSMRWFMMVWATYYSHVKCRKWLRFAKCVICVSLRTIIANRLLSKQERRAAADELAVHYVEMKRERAYHRK